MKVSGFTFLRNAELLGYPFIQSIKSVLPICDEFVVNVGLGVDNTIEQLRALNEPKIRIVESKWNEVMTTKGYVYGQQKNIAHFNCTGDWAFYLEGDEVVHEDDLKTIYSSMEQNLDNPKVEALVFDYIHFYGNKNTYAYGPGWYRKAPRIIKNSIRSYSPDGLFFVVLETNKKGRYPYAKLVGAPIYHYGWVRNERDMNEKLDQVSKYWKHTPKKIEYANFCSDFLREFKGTHPKIMQDWFVETGDSMFKTSAEYKLSSREKKHLLMMKLEDAVGLDFSRKHFKLVG